MREVPGHQRAMVLLRTLALQASVVLEIISSFHVLQHELHRLRLLVHSERLSRGIP